MFLFCLFILCTDGIHKLNKQRNKRLFIDLWQPKVEIMSFLWLQNWLITSVILLMLNSE